MTNQLTNIDLSHLAGVTGGTVILDTRRRPPPDRTNCGFDKLGELLNKQPQGEARPSTIGDLAKVTPDYLLPRAPTYGELTGQ